MLHAPDVELQVVEIGHAACRMYHAIGVHFLFAAAVELHAMSVTCGCDGAHLGADSHVDAKRPRPLHQTLHEVRIESLERMPAAMEDDDASAGSRCDVGK